ncbi:MAG TPA: ribonuclease HII [Caldisericia bacterium]|jgi:ribonuclease HII|nr:ribonuclease HII [Caldisericia bacterium]HXK51227.1 ribonuclease HII [Caldisericia bacterium]
MLNIDQTDSDLWHNEYILAQQYPDFAIIGIDEAGRGSLAGPVAASAVCYLGCCTKPAVKDSKKLTPKQREFAYHQIHQSGALIATSFISPRMIDRMNILNATQLAMKKCIDQLLDREELRQHSILFLIDGNQPLTNEYRGIQQTCIKGDSMYSSIASASIIAKVERDRYMVQMDAVFPCYGFAIHKGYGTKNHYQALQMQGCSTFHRKTFLKVKNEGN